MITLRALFRKNLFFFIGAGLLAFGLLWLLLAYSPHSTFVDFQEYAPRILPARISSTGRTLNAWSAKSGLFVNKKVLTFSLNTPHSFISEERNTHFSYTCNTSVRNETCQVLETPRHQKYLLSTSYDGIGNTQPFDQTVAWVRGDTHIWVTLQGSPVSTYSAQTWSQVIDSFHPVFYNKVVIKHYTPGP